MRWILIVAVLVGCDPCSCEPSADIKARAAELSSGFKKNTDVIVSKQDETLNALAAIKSQVEDVQASLVETRQAVGTMEASMKAPALNMLGGDPAALEPQEPTRPNLSQPIKPVASAPAVRSSGPLKLSWNVEGNWNPTILETARHLREDHGIIADGMTHQQMHDAHAAAHEGRPVAIKSPTVQFVNRGTSCPGGICPTRQSVRIRWRR
jgi:hypothetical protein